MTIERQETEKFITLGSDMSEGVRLNGYPFTRIDQETVFTTHDMSEEGRSGLRTKQSSTPPKIDQV